MSEQKIKVKKADGQEAEYLVSDLNEEAQKALRGLTASQNELNRLQTQANLIRTAAAAYQQVLSNNLPKE